MAQVQATTGFVRQYGGQEVMVEAGDILDADHEIVRSTPSEWWKPLTSRFAPVEEATAKPGRKRPVKVEDES